jgi:hypothetical protein
VKRSVTMLEAGGVEGAADSTPPRHRTQLPSDDSRSLCCEVDASSWVQPSGQQMPSIALRNPNTTKSAAATSLRTALIILCFWRRSPAQRLASNQHSGAINMQRSMKVVDPDGNKLHICTRLSDWDINAEWQPEPTLNTEIEVRFIPDGDNVTRVELEHRHLDRYGARRDEMRRIFDVEGDWGRLLVLFACAATISGH